MPTPPQRPACARAVWWLDVEGGTLSKTMFSDFTSGIYWGNNPALNAQTVQGAIDALHQEGLTVGIYSTSVQYPVITGGLVPVGAQVPIWVAGVPLTNPPYNANYSKPSILSTWCAGTAKYPASHRTRRTTCSPAAFRGSSKRRRGAPRARTGSTPTTAAEPLRPVAAPTRPASWRPEGLGRLETVAVRSITASSCAGLELSRRSTSGKVLPTSVRARTGACTGALSRRSVAGNGLPSAGRKVRLGEGAPAGSARHGLRTPMHRGERNRAAARAKAFSCSGGSPAAGGNCRYACATAMPARLPVLVTVTLASRPGRRHFRGETGRERGVRGSPKPKGKSGWRFFACSYRYPTSRPSP